MDIGIINIKALKSRQNITAKGCRSLRTIRMATKELPHRKTAPIIARVGSIFLIFIGTNHP